MLAVFVAGSLLGCGSPPPPDPGVAITIATGGTGGVYYPLGTALADVYTSRLPGVHASALATVASVFNVHAVQEGKADLAFTQGDVAYFAYTRGTDADPRPHSKLRGVAVLYVNDVHILTRRDSPIRSVRDFRGRRVGVGAAGSGTEVAARIIIEGYGLKYADVAADFASFSEVASRMRDRTLDAGFIVASYPVSAITDTSLAVGVRLIPVEQQAVDRIRAQYPFFRPVVIPRGTYRDQADDVNTIGVDNLLVCRADLPEELVYELTRVFFEALPNLMRTHLAATLIDPEAGPATPIPLHPGAARYYRAREMLR